MSNKTTSFTPNMQLCIGLIFSIGVLASLALVLAALVAVAYVLNVAMTFICAVVANIHTLYARSDSFTQLLILCIIGYILFALVRRAVKSQK